MINCLVRLPATLKDLKEVSFKALLSDRGNQIYRTLKRCESHMATGFFWVLLNADPYVFPGILWAFLLQKKDDGFPTVGTRSPRRSMIQYKRDCRDFHEVFNSLNIFHVWTQVHLLLRK